MGVVEAQLSKRIGSRLRFERLKLRTDHRPSPQSLIGCTYKQLARYLRADSLIPANVDLDHIIPLYYYDLSTVRGLQSAFHFSNLQLIPHDENLRKGVTLPALAQLQQMPPTSIPETVQAAATLLSLR